ncbi:trypsin-like serine protease [soil metagenome]
MKESNVLKLRLLGTVSVVGIALAACAAPTEVSPAEEEATGTTESAIINGTATTLAQNSFVRLPVSGCTGTLLNNRWVLTANHCAAHVGDSVTMDSQARTVAEVRPHPDTLYGVDIALLRLSAPMSHAGSTTAFSRTIRTTVAPQGTHVRCFGYGHAVNANGTTTQLRLMELGTYGGANDVYYLEKNALLQSAAPGDAGGGCLDDTGAVIGVMRSFTNAAPSLPGETAMITSATYAAWARSIIPNVCSSNADCGWFRACTAGQCVVPPFSQ